MIMTSTKYKVEKFIGLNDFGLWWLKMHSLFVYWASLMLWRGNPTLYKNRILHQLWEAFYIGSTTNGDADDVESP